MKPIFLTAIIALMSVHALAETELSQFNGDFILVNEKKSGIEDKAHYQACSSNLLIEEHHIKRESGVRDYLSVVEYSQSGAVSAINFLDVGHAEKNKKEFSEGQLFHNTFSVVFFKSTLFHPQGKEVKAIYLAANSANDKEGFDLYFEKATKGSITTACKYLRKP